MFITVNEKTMNKQHLGEVIFKPRELKIIYRFKGGRMEEEVFSTQEEFESKKEELKGL